MTSQNKSDINRALPVIFDMTSRECLWSKVGVVKPRMCHNAFDCLSCSFDRRMRRMNLSMERPWTRERWLATPPEERYCRHMLTGRVSQKLCMHAYQCSDCSYDQMMDDEILYSGGRDVECTPAGGVMAATEYYYHSGHVWARVEYGGRVRLGLDDLAARLFGPADKLDLPDIGHRLDRESPGASMRRGDKSARLASPVKGVVVARNPSVMARPAQAAADPYGQGWLMLLEPASLQKDLKGLTSGEAVAPWFEAEVQRLSDLLTAHTGQRLAATGGLLLPDIYGSVPGLDWDQLADSFLAG